MTAHQCISRADVSFISWYAYSVSILLYIWCDYYVGNLHSSKALLLTYLWPVVALVDIHGFRENISTDVKLPSAHRRCILQYK